MDWVCRILNFHSGKNPNKLDGMDVEIYLAYLATVRKIARNTQRQALNDTGCSKNKDYNKMVDQIDQCRGKQFVGPITLDAKYGKITIQPQRTNNLLERFFRNLKRGYRKKVN